MPEKPNSYQLTPKRKKILLIVIIGVLLLFQLLWHASTIAHVYDEVLYSAAGYSHWTTGDFKLTILYHPPLSKLIMAVPHLFLKPELRLDSARWRSEDAWGFGTQFIYDNQEYSLEEMIFWPRVAIAAQTLLLFVLVSAWVWHRLGRTEAVFAAILFALDPNLIAFGSLATTDSTMVFFWFLTVIGALEFRARPSYARMLLAATMLGAAMLSKHSAWMLIPAVLIAPWLPARIGAQHLSMSRRIIFTLLGAAVPIAMIAAAYSSLPSWVYPYSVMGTLHDAKLSTHVTFLLGDAGFDGWWYYFLVIPFLKLPWLHLLSVFAGFFVMMRKNVEWAGFFVLPVLGIVAVGGMVKWQLGYAYMLPFSLVAVVFGSAALGAVHKRFRRVSVVVLLLIALQTFELARVAPHYLSYFPFWAGGPENGHRLASNMNFDLGQNVPQLRKAWEEHGRPEMTIGYLGSCQLVDWGLEEYIPLWGFEQMKAPGTPQSDRYWLVLGGTVLSSFQRLHPEFGEYFYNREADIRPEGWTFLVYDVTDDMVAQEKLANFHEKVGNDAAAEMWRERMRRRSNLEENR